MNEQMMTDILTERFPNVPKALVREYVDGVYEHEDPSTINMDRYARICDFRTYMKYRKILRNLYTH